MSLSLFTMDFALLVTEKEHISSCGSFPFSGRSQHWCQLLVWLLAPLPARAFLVSGALVAARATSSQFSHTLRTLFTNSALFLLTPFQGDRDTCADLIGLAIAQPCNKKPTSSSIVDHGSATRIFVDFSRYSKRSGQRGNRNSNELQMENYLME